MFELNLEKNPIVYVTRDLERALGLPLTTPSYFIISNVTPFAKTVAAGHENVLLIESPELLDTHELLTRPETIEFIEKNPHVRILVFKNTSTIEKICAEKNWRLLNPSAELANKVEEKISQVAWLGKMAEYLPPHKIQVLKEVEFSGTPFILQFNRAHTGLGTMLIDEETKLTDLQTKFPDRPVRVTDFIEGPMFTSNNVVCENNIITGNISYQITGLAPFTDSAFTTVGNDWSLGKKFITGEIYKHYDRIVVDVGTKLYRNGWRGLFGVDIIFDIKKEKLYLIEINARQSASTTYESQLQSAHEDVTPEFQYTAFEAHLTALHGGNVFVEDMIEITDGAQIILRNQTDKIITDAQVEHLSAALSDLGFTCISYPNTLPGTDRLRIQSAESFFRAPEKFNEIGKIIVDTINQILV